jgi:hypothetical protein
MPDICPCDYRRSVTTSRCFLDAGLGSKCAAPLSLFVHSEIGSLWPRARHLGPFAYAGCKCPASAQAVAVWRSNTASRGGVRVLRDRSRAVWRRTKDGSPTWVVQLAGCPAENAISGEQIRQVLRMKTLIVVERPVPGLSGGINSQSHLKIIARVSLSYGAFAPCALRPSDYAQPVALPAVNGKIPASLVSAAWASRGRTPLRRCSAGFGSGGCRSHLGLRHNSNHQKYRGARIRVFSKEITGMPDDANGDARHSGPLRRDPPSR